MKLFQIKLIAPNGDGYLVFQTPRYNEEFNAEIEAQNEAKQILTECKLSNFTYKITQEEKSGGRVSCFETDFGKWLKTFGAEQYTEEPPYDNLCACMPTTVLISYWSLLNHYGEVKTYNMTNQFVEEVE